MGVPVLPSPVQDYGLLAMARRSLVQCYLSTSYYLMPFLHVPTFLAVSASALRVLIPV